MNKFRALMLFVLGGSLMAVNAQAAPERVGDFALLDGTGDFHQLSRYRHRDALVVMAYAGSCSSMDTMIAQFQSVQAQWQEQGIAFAMIDSEDSGRQAAAAMNAGMPVLVDDGQLVSETLSLANAGEVVVLDPERLTVLYRGPIHDHLGGYIQSAKAGTVDDTHVMTVNGCAINYQARDMHASNVPDYATEVAPIIAEQCATCHREGGIGPFAINSHLMLMGWSPMIREVLLTKRMPPEQVDPYVGHFENARYISQQELQTLVHWIDAGSPRGSATVDPLAELSFPDHDDWQLGEPDYIVKAPVHEIPATGVLDYINVDVELPFDEDKWVRGVQYIAGDESVLHHLLTYVTAPLETAEGEAAQGSVATRFLEGYAPGKVDAMMFPEDTGVYIPKGHKLSMQFHYTTNGRATTDETLLGLYMYDEPPEHENFTRSVAGMFLIPPYARDHKASARYTFDEDVVVTGLRAHMHFRGKDMKFTVEYPDGTTKDLLSVPAYSYAWQPTYQLSEPTLLPAGTTAHVTGTFDNSEFNPANPDPSKRLSFGLQSWDEMFIGYWTYHAAD
jgi:peroxiredoxin